MTLLALLATTGGPGDPTEHPPIPMAARTEYELGAERTSLAGLTSYLDAVAAEAGTLGMPVTVSSYGTTTAGRAIPMLTIGAGPGRPALLQAGIHGNEPMPPEAVLTFIREVIGTTDPTLSAFLTQRRLLVIPALNIDGLVDGNRNIGTNDPNRDLLAVTLPEIRAYVTLVAGEMPIAIYDGHEQAPSGTRADIEYLTGLVGTVPVALSQHAIDALNDAIRPALTADAFDHKWYHSSSHGTVTNTAALRGVPATLVESERVVGNEARRHAGHVAAMRAWLHDVAARAGAYEAVGESIRSAIATHTGPWELTALHPPLAAASTQVTASGYELSAAQYAAAQAALDAHGITATSDGTTWTVTLHGQATAAIAVHLLDPNAPARIVAATRLS